MMRKIFINLIALVGIVFSPIIYCLDSTCKNDIEKIISLYKLSPLEFEGGYFRRTYTLKNNNANKSLQATAIIYLLRNGDKSVIHKLGSDEIYHFYTGDPVTMLMLNEDGTTKIVTLGNDVLHDQQVQVIVPKHTWQGSYLSKGGCYALLGTTMMPGFDFKKFKYGIRKELIKKYPKEAEKIMNLTM
jgi:uncharacterized protein